MVPGEQRLRQSSALTSRFSCSVPTRYGWDMILVESRSLWILELKWSGMKGVWLESSDNIQLKELICAYVTEVVMAVIQVRKLHKVCILS